MAKSLSNSVHTNLNIFETVHSRVDSCGRCLNLIWKAVTKRCGFYERISNWFHVNKSRFVLKKICGYQIFGFVWTRPKVTSKRIRINFVKLHILFARIYLPFTRKHWIRPPKPHVFETTLHSAFFLDSKDLRSRVDYHDWNRVCFILFTQVYTFSQPPPPPPGFVWTGSESETNTKKRSCHSVPGGKQSTI